MAVRVEAAFEPRVLTRVLTRSRWSLWRCLTSRHAAALGGTLTSGPGDSGWEPAALMSVDEAAEHPSPLSSRREDSYSDRLPETRGGVAGTRPWADEVDSGLWVTHTHCPRGGLCPPHGVTRRRTWWAHGIIPRPGRQREPSAQGQRPHPRSGWLDGDLAPGAERGALRVHRLSCYEISSLSALPVPGKREQVLERPRLRVICAPSGIPAPGPPVTGNRWVCGGPGVPSEVCGCVRHDLSRSGQCPRKGGMGVSTWEFTWDCRPAGPRRTTRPPGCRSLPDESRSPGPGS